MRDVGRWLGAGSLRGIGLNLGSALIAIVAVGLMVPSASFADPVLISALAAVSGVAFAAESRLKHASRVFYSSTLAIALVALATVGPLPALAIWLVPDLLARFVLRSEPRLSPGFVANVSSFALAIGGGALVLDLAASSSGLAQAPSLYLAGVVMWAINFAFARLAFAPFFQGYRPAVLIRDEFFGLAISTFAMLAVAVTAAVLTTSIGIVALAVLAAVIIVPQTLLDGFAVARPVSNLSRLEATRLYSQALADVLELPRSDRESLSTAAGLIDRFDPRLGVEDGDRSLADVSYSAFAALHVHERWEGGGWPAGLPAEAIPLQSRVLAVCDAWAAVTAAGTAELGQREAILTLAAQSGVALDPAIVDAAERVVADEEGFASDDAFAPRLHRLPLPRTIRRDRLPAMLLRVANE